ncbi:hypothetical protein AMECASPLE_023790 [Ameca splendens]|uniref:Uncharacterized protein n=1 Tax=Ameca splendens TaxID=208324 RepID=A0ABV0YR47_9TELE
MLETFLPLKAHIDGPMVVVVEELRLLLEALSVIVELQAAVICYQELPVSFDSLADLEHHGASPLLVLLAGGRCSFQPESGVESLSDAKLGLTLMPAGRE